MKKEYSAPKAEKLEFNYTEAVVACRSGSICDGLTHDLPGTGGWICNQKAYYMINGVCDNQNNSNG